jgi:hypothetical protein
MYEGFAQTCGKLCLSVRVCLSVCNLKSLDRCFCNISNKLEPVKHNKCIMLKSDQGWLHVSASLEAIIRPFVVEQFDQV